MNGDLIARVLYLVLLGAAVVGSLIVQSRGKRNQVFQQLSIWGLIFIGVIAGVGLWSDISKNVLPQQASFGPGGTVSIPQGPDGHYHVTVEVNGQPVRFMVDTGASDIVLTPRDARRAGIDPGQLAYVGTAMTANGTVATARVRLASVRLGPFVTHDVAASVNRVGMSSSLLGMAYLERFGKIEIAGGRMVLSR
ncbi:MAG: TIGR02281 family clan AA aspartic protease [Paracoccaceae bacterium]|nr:TIGR02281 family clan AA aspartic protease [Paracoccaceae bacterium]